MRNIVRIRWQRRGLLTLAMGAVFAGSAHAAVLTFANSAPITMPPLGLASPYPSEILASGVSGDVIGLSVTLIGFSHGFPDDAGVLLIGPTGAGQIVFNGGTFTPISSADLTFKDGGAAWPSSGPVGSGTYQPFSFYEGDLFAAPAPEIPGVNATTAGSKSFAMFDALDPNGAWLLFVEDFTEGDPGSIGGGWVLSITTAAIPGPPTLLALGLGALGLCVAGRLDPLLHGRHALLRLASLIKTWRTSR